VFGALSIEVSLFKAWIHLVRSIFPTDPISIIFFPFLPERKFYAYYHKSTYM
jgi:hypothetical protein